MQQDPEVLSEPESQESVASLERPPGLTIWEIQFGGGKMNRCILLYDCMYLAGFVFYFSILSIYNTMFEFLLMHVCITIDYIYIY